MGKPNHAKPPYFRECPICHREFGSKSIEIHVSRCLDRQKSSSDLEDSDNITESTSSPRKNGDNKTKQISKDKKRGPGQGNGRKPGQKKHLSKVRSRRHHSSEDEADDDDEDVETSLSDELSHSWPAKSKSKNRNAKNLNNNNNAKNNNNNNNNNNDNNENGNNKNKKKNKNNMDMESSLSVKVVPAVWRKTNKRKRERKGRSSSGDDDHRPKTATLKRPHILDETLKDKVDMTLTKKEFLAAVKLCSDVSVQRGLPNMRLRASKNFLTSGSNSNSNKNSNSKNDGSVGAKAKNLSQPAGYHKIKASTTGVTPKLGVEAAPPAVNSPYLTNLAGKVCKRKAPTDNLPAKFKEPETQLEKIRPMTTRLERPSNASLDLPHIHVKPHTFRQNAQPPQHVISSRLTRQLRLRGGKTRRNSSTSLTGFALSNNSNSESPAAKPVEPITVSQRYPLRKKPVTLPKDKVPEACRSCGRSDFPERLHTHPPNEQHDHHHHHHHPHNHSHNNQQQQQQSKIPVKHEPASSPTKKTILEHQQTQTPITNRPWVSPKMREKRQRQRSLSLDTTVLEPLLNTIKEPHKKATSSPPKNKLASRQQQQKGLKVIDVSDDLVVSEETDVEMANNNNASDCEVIIVDNVQEQKPKSNKSQKGRPQKNNKEAHMSVDESDPHTSSSNESSSSEQQKLQKSKKFPPPPPLTNKQKTQSSASLASSSGKTVPELTPMETGNSDDDNDKTTLGLVNCNVCGKQFGKVSIKFHLPQCQKKQEAQKVKQQQQDTELKKENQEEINIAVPEYNEAFEAIWEAHVQQLIPCKNCNRTFFPDRIKVHQKSCKGSGVKVTVNASNSSPAKTAENAPNSVDILLSSPSLIRRQLHNQQDAVVVTADDFQVSPNHGKANETIDT